MRIKIWKLNIFLKIYNFTKSILSQNILILHNITRHPPTITYFLGHFLKTDNTKQPSKNPTHMCIDQHKSGFLDPKKVPSSQSIQLSYILFAHFTTFLLFDIFHFSFPLLDKRQRKEKSFPFSGTSLWAEQQYMMMVMMMFVLWSPRAKKKIYTVKIFVKKIKKFPQSTQKTIFESMCRESMCMIFFFFPKLHLLIFFFCVFFFLCAFG